MKLTDETFFKSWPISEENPRLFMHHHLEGFLYKFHPQGNENQFWKNAWKTQYWRNFNALEILKELSPKISEKNISPYLLKGAALLEELYPDMGSRFMSDVDILIVPEEREILEKVLSESGFELVTSEKWKGNAHKSEWTIEKDGNEYVIEVHEKLFWHKNIKWQNESIVNSDFPYKKLDRELHLLFLIGHYAFQHNFTKSYWLMDIVLYLEEFQDEIDWNIFNELMEKLELSKSVEMTFWVIKKYFDWRPNETINERFNLKTKRSWQKYLTTEFLWSIEQGGLKYWLIKHLTKNSLSQALLYDFLWLKRKVLK